MRHRQSKPKGPISRLQNSPLRGLAAATVLIILLIFTLGAYVSSQQAPAQAHKYVESDDPFAPPPLLQQETADEEEVPEDSVLRTFDLRHLHAEKVQAVVDDADIDVNLLLLYARPYTLWAQGTEDDLEGLAELIGHLDQADSTLSLQHETISTRYVPPDRMVELLQVAGVKLDRYVILGNQILVFDAELLPRWDSIEQLARRLDAPGGREKQVFVYRLRYLSADSASELLDSAGIDGVQTETYTDEYEGLSSELIVICPPERHAEVSSVLETLDSAQSRIRVPLTSVSGDNALEQLRAERDLLSEISGMPSGRMHISDNLSGDRNDPRHVLWVEATPQKVRQLQEILDEFR